MPLASLNATIKKVHPMPAAFKADAQKAAFIPVEQTANSVLFADYNMVQAETRWVRNNSAYNPADEPVVSVFNNYFGGGGMGTVVFQTLREAKALAYSTFAFYVTPDKKEDPYYTIAYIGSQADKFNEAAASMNELLNEVPNVQNSIDFAKESLRKDIETERITQDGIILNYLAAQQKGLNEDIRKKVYESIDKIGYKELKAFHAKNFAGKPYTYAIVASEKKINLDDVKKYGEFKKLSLEEIFGY
jgi:predicted Zn-dependent peptidase